MSGVLRKTHRLLIRQVVIFLQFFLVDVPTDEDCEVWVSCLTFCNAEIATHPATQQIFTVVILECHLDTCCNEMCPVCDASKWTKTLILYKPVFQKFLFH